MTNETLDDITMRGTRFVRRVAGKATGELAVAYRDLTLRFATDAPHAWRWFTPLYAPGRVHEPGLSDVLYRELGPTSVFLDVGANLGYFTVMASSICRQGAVHAFEIDPQIAARIPVSLALNPDHGPVKLNCVAVSGRSGELVSFAPAQEGNASTNVLCDAAAGADAQDAQDGEAPLEVRVATLTLDDYCAAQGVEPDVVKMDIEGAEAFAIEGMASILRTSRPIVILEVHPPQIRRFGRDPAEVVAVLSDANYTLEVIPEYREPVDGGERELEPYDPASVAGDRPVMVVARP